MSQKEKKQSLIDINEYIVKNKKTDSMKVKSVFIITAAIALVIVFAVTIVLLVYFLN